MPKLQRKSSRSKRAYNVEYRKRGSNINGNVQANRNRCNFTLFPLSLTNDEIRLGENFNNMCTPVTWRTCQNCKRSFPNLSMKGIKCVKCVKSATKFTAINNMDPGVVPDELKNLTYIEEMLIAMIHPVVSIYRLKGGQYGHTGNVINFRQKIEDYITKLPLHPKDLPSTLLFKKYTDCGIAEFRVRAVKIRNALLWLKKNNIFYRGLEIDEDVINILPADGDIGEFSTSLNIEDDDEEINDNQYGLNEYNIPKFDNINQESIINDELELDYPEQVWHLYH